MAYFVRIKNRIFGPFDEPELLAMKSKGKITSITEISEDKVNWNPAKSFSFLYELTPSASITCLPANNETADWFYSINGTEGYGPVTASAIEQMLQSGQLDGNCYIWRQGDEESDIRLLKREKRFAAVIPVPPN